MTATGISEPGYLVAGNDDRAEAIPKEGQSKELLCRRKVSLHQLISADA